MTMNLNFLEVASAKAINRLRARFSQAPKLYLQSQQGSRELSGSSKRVLWVMSRALLKHETFLVPDGLSQSQRRSALELQVRRWAPFPRTRHAAYWSGNLACVYAWDEEKVIPAIENEALRQSDCKVMPETFLRAAAGDGVRLVNAIDGVEGQVWRESVPVATRWWPAAPSQQEWASFLRAARMPPGAVGYARPEPVDVPFLEQPWSVNASLADEALDVLDSPRNRAAAAALALAVPVFLGTQLMAVGRSTAALEAELGTISAASEPIRKQRDAALSDLDAIDQLLGFERFPPHFAVLHRVFESLAGQEIKIADWTYDTGALEFSLEAREPMDATRYIELFERDDLFENVSSRTLPQPNTLRLKMDVAPVVTAKP